MTKPTIAALALHLGRPVQTLYARKKKHPKEWELIWSGWVQFTKGDNND